MEDRRPVADGNEDLLAAYAATRLEFRDPGTGLDLVLHPEPRGRFGGWPFPGVACAAVVTAWHPRSQRGRDPAHDRADLEELRRVVLQAGFRAIDCVGIGSATDAGPAAAAGGAKVVTEDEVWAEPSLLVPGLDRETAREWAAAWEQNAIFCWTPADWRIVGVRLAMPDVVLGWSIARRA